jgi:hypothetical protein
MSRQAKSQKTETRVVVTRRTRPGSRLALESSDVDDPSIDALRAAPPGCWLYGGEPTLRADLPALIAALGALGIASDGLALTDERAVAALMEAGLSRVRIFVHAARSDAHDWLAGMDGALKRALRAIRICRAADLAVEIAATVTRPTLPHLEELIALASRLGVERVTLSQLRWQGAPPEAVTLAPRYGLVDAPLRQAIARAAREGVIVHHDFPACAAPGAIEQRREPTYWRDAPRRMVHCANCPRAPGCDGAPESYVARFGWSELPSAAVDERDATLRVTFGAPSPMACADCGDGVREVESTRAIRLRLVQAARRRPRCIRVTGPSLRHPAAAAMLRELTLLDLPRIEIAGEAAGLSEMSDADLYPLKGIAQLDVALFGPDARAHDAHTGEVGSFDRALDGARRFEAITGAALGSYAVLHDATPLAAFERAWAEGRLPGVPTLRLSSAGGSLPAFALAAAQLPEGAMRHAARQVVPPCQLDRDVPRSPVAPVGSSFSHDIDRATPPSGSDSRAMLEACVCDPALRAGCPGVAAGWTIEPVVDEAKDT